MPLPIIQEDTDYVAIPIETQDVPRKVSNIAQYDVEANDRWAGLKHGGLCILMLGMLGFMIYLFIKVWP